MILMAFEILALLSTGGMAVLWYQDQSGNYEPLIVICGLLAAAVQVFRSFKGYLAPVEANPVGDSDVRKMTPFKIVPATADDIHWVALTAKKLYGSRTAIPVDTKLAWYSASPKGFQILKDRNGARRGCCELLPLTEDAFRRFQNGKLRESNIQASDLTPPTADGQHRIVYLSNLMAVNDENRVITQGASMMYKNLCKVLQDMGADMESGKLYAMPVQKYYENGHRCRSRSEEHLRRKGFSQLGYTKQGFSLYWKDISDLCCHRQKRQNSGF